MKVTRNLREKTRAAFEAEVTRELGVALSDATDGRISVVQAEPSLTTGPSPDLTLWLDVAGRSVEVAVTALRFAYPRDIQGALWKLAEYKRASSFRRIWSFWSLQRY